MSYGDSSLASYIHFFFDICLSAKWSFGKTIFGHRTDSFIIDHVYIQILGGIIENQGGYGGDRIRHFPLKMRLIIAIWGPHITPCPGPPQW